MNHRRTMFLLLFLLFNSVGVGFVCSRVQSLQPVESRFEFFYKFLQYHPHATKYQTRARTQTAPSGSDFLDSCLLTCQYYQFNCFILDYCKWEIYTRLKTKNTQISETIIWIFNLRVSPAKFFISTRQKNHNIYFD